MSLFKAETRRLTKRRFTRLLVIGLTVILAAIAVGMFVTNHKNTQREATVNNEIPFLPAEKRTTTTTTTTRDQTEYRITYRRLGGPSAPPPPVTPAGAQVPATPKPTDLPPPGK